MALAKTVNKISIADYLAGELVSEVKHEYIDGEVHAMAGTSRQHNRVARRLLARLESHLEDGPCEPFFAELKVYVPAVNCFYYPDLAVTCDPTDDDEYYLTRPVLLVEVLSLSTARIDRREKLSSYQTLESLQEYLILAQDRVEATLYRRLADGGWKPYELAEGDILRLDSVGLELPLAELYEGAVFS